MLHQASSSSSSTSYNEDGGVQVTVAASTLSYSPGSSLGHLSRFLYPWSGANRVQERRKTGYKGIFPINWGVTMGISI